MYLPSSINVHVGLKITRPLCPGSTGTFKPDIMKCFLMVSEYTSPLRKSLCRKIGIREMHDCLCGFLHGQKTLQLELMP